MLVGNLVRKFSLVPKTWLEQWKWSPVLFQHNKDRQHTYLCDVLSSELLSLVSPNNKTGILHAIQFICIFILPGTISDKLLQSTVKPDKNIDLYCNNSFILFRVFFSKKAKKESFLKFNPEKITEQRHAQGFLRQNLYRVIQKYKKLLWVNLIKKFLMFISLLHYLCFVSGGTPFVLECPSVP